MSQSLMSSNKLASDPYFKKNVFFRYRGHDLNFRVSQSLFSSQDIDLGTKHLLKTLTEHGVGKCEKVLDLGCGYGPIGIAIKTISPSSRVHMVDKDALALEYSQINAELNNVPAIKIYGSLGYDDVSDTDFDLIISNVPAKVGDRVLDYILKGARHHLRPGGRVAIVVIDAIGDYVTKALADSDIKILFHKRWPEHLVFHYEFLPQTVPTAKPNLDAFELEIYNRSEKALLLFDSVVLIKTTYNLPEFDTLSYETELLLESLKIIRGQHIERAIVFNPCQGFIPVALFKTAAVTQIDLIDRDLQALKISKENLVTNGYPAERINMTHQVGILGKEESDKSEYVIGVLPEKDGPLVHAMFVRQAASRLTNNGLLVISSTSTSITRIETFIRKEKLFNRLGERRSKGRAILTLKSK